MPYGTMRLHWSTLVVEAAYHLNLCFALVVCKYMLPMLVCCDGTEYNIIDQLIIKTESSNKVWVFALHLLLTKLTKLTLSNFKTKLKKLWYLEISIIIYLLKWIKTNSIKSKQLTKLIKLNKIIYLITPRRGITPLSDRGKICYIGKICYSFILKFPFIFEHIKYGTVYIQYINQRNQNLTLSELQNLVCHDW